MSKKSKEVAVINVTDLSETSKGFEIHEALKQRYEKLKRAKDEPFVVHDLSSLGCDIGDIREVKDQDTLRKAMMMISGYFEKAPQADAKLGWDAEDEYKIGGGTEEQWVKVIQQQWTNVSQAANLAKLEKLMEKSKAFITEEEKKHMFLQELKEAKSLLVD